MLKFDPKAEVREMSKSSIREIAPSVFTKNSFEKTSDKYVHIPTERVIDDMKSLGWVVTEAQEVKARSNQGFQKHMLVFRNPDVFVEAKDGDHMMPQIIVTNSHDGRNSFQFMAGIFRLVCSNGLVVADEQFEDIKIRHMGYDLKELQITINNIMEKLPLTVEAMNKFQNKILDQEEKEKFVLEALGLRFNTEKKKFEVEDILSPNREADKGDTLWKVFNVIQEKLLKGDVQYQNSNNKKSRKARKIKNFQQNAKINQELYKLALNYA